MTTQTAPRPTAPAIGLFGAGKPSQEAAAQAATHGRGDSNATQRKAFSGLFRADGTDLHTA